MVSIKDIAQGRSDIYRVAPSVLKVKEGWNSRDLNDEENKFHIMALAKSIAADGVKEPLTVYQEDGEVYIENGHCRHAASLLAISEYGAPADLTVPIKIGDKKATPADRILSQVILNSGKALSALEMGRVYKKLKDLEMSNEEIAQRCNVSRVYVGQLLGLIDMPTEITELVRTGAVSATLAIETVKEHKGDTEAATAALVEAVGTAKAHGKERATAKHVKPAKEKAAPKPSLKLRLREVFEKVQTDNLKDNDKVCLTFSKADYEEFVAMVGLNKSVEELKEDDVI